MAREAYEGLRSHPDAPFDLVNAAGNTLVRMLLETDRLRYTAQDPQESPELTEAINLLRTLNAACTQRDRYQLGDTRLLAQLCYRADRSSEVIEVLKQEFELAQSVNEYESDHVIKCSAWYSRALTGSGRDLETAVALMDKAIAFDIKSNPDGTSWAFWYRSIQASALRQLGRAQEALRVLDTNAEVIRAHGEGAPWSVAYYYAERIRTLVALHRLDEAAQVISPGQEAVVRLNDARSRTSRDFEAAHAALSEAARDSAQDSVLK